MNRFRTRRKAKEEAAAKLPVEPKHSAESEASNPFRLFNKAKKSHDEPVEKPIDLTTVLPPSDDFRTSLLMTGLSARFSMLREQDDPNTKIGKASDDSVLFPTKRQSRVNDLAFRGLGDIAEVESIRAPPSLTRMDSYNSSSDADSTNVMNRPRPSEGNVLFGGRQKIYKISGASSSSGGGMGKPIYGDDVALSAFQKWKQAEREKQASYEEDDAANTVSSPLSRNSELEALRPESPPTYNRNRETGSTTSSAPSASRNSTAATSINSQKDWHYLGSSATSPTPILEKTVARTRRLYEQGLTQDLQNQQSHALSRIDTLSRRTPDISQNSSPTGHYFGERAMDRRLLSKGSAPNMQTMNRPAAARSVTSPTDMGLRTSGASEAKHSGASPPLSPPISEHDDHSILQIQSSDRGKATAMGVFQKPAQPYDESRFAQRQIQMQQGRDTPTQGFRTESDASRLAQSSPSPVAPKSPTASKRDVSPVEDYPPVDSYKQSLTFFDDDNDDSLPDMSQDRQMPDIQPPQVRPADKDHPAFRSSALPTPLSFNFKDSDDGQTSLTTPNTSGPSTDKDPKDSPTLGPPAGLSGMVRQHLRSDSGASSVYEAEPHLGAPSNKPPVEAFNSKDLDDLVSDLNPWSSQDQDWTASFYSSHTKDDGPASPAAKVHDHTAFSQSASSRQSVASSDVGAMNDPFHSQLADGARRIRERLTTYVETDGGNSRDLASTPELTPRPGPLGGLLRKQSSRGSLDKHRDASKPAKAIKLLGIGNATMSTSPSPNKQSFEESDRVHAPTQSVRQSPERGSPGKSSGEEEKGDTAHAGLRQFRQARRELQRLKEAETMQRHQKSPTHGPEAANGGSPMNRGPPPQSRPSQGRSPSRERRPPPISYSRAPSTEPWAGPGSNPGSRAASRTGSRPSSRADRDRSGSEASTGGMSHSRPPPRLRSGPRDEYQHGPQHGPKPSPMQGPPGPPRQGPMMRANGPPGSDMRRSPMAPAQPYSPHGQSEWPGPNNPGAMQHQQQRGMPSGQLSPISPMGDLPSPYMVPDRSTPNGTAPSSRRPSAPPVPAPDQGGNMARLDETMKRVIRKKDISEPTFVSSTSRVPTVNLPEDTATRSRAGSRSRSGSLLKSGSATASTPNLHSLQHSHAHAPPLPPINPRRRNNVMGGLMGRKGEEDMGLDSPQQPFASSGADAGDDNRSTFSVSDEENGRDRRRLRKATSEANVGSRSRSGTLRNSPPHLTGFSSASPAVRSNGMPGGLI